MTERLSHLLHDEADRLDVPAPAAAEVLARGRRVRRGRRTVAAVAAVAVLGVVAGAGAGFIVDALDAGSRGDAADPTGARAADMGAVFTIGTTLYYDDGSKQVTIADGAVKSTYLTSVGVLVRSGDNAASDGGGRQRFQLVTPDGEVRPVSVVTEEVSPGVDAGQPYLAYPEVVDGTVDVVVHDVSTDEEVARVPVPEADPEGLAGAGVALTGDNVYLGADSATEQLVVNWRTGVITPIPPVTVGLPAIYGGRVSLGYGATATVVDAATGDVLLSVPTGGHGFFVLSPDGRYARLQVGGLGKPGVDVYQVDTGRHSTVPGRGLTFGWTAGSELFKVQDDQVTICPSGRPCSVETFDGSTQEGYTRLLGQTYES